MLSVREELRNVAGNTTGRTTRRVRSIDPTTWSEATILTHSNGHSVVELKVTDDDTLVAVDHVGGVVFSVDTSLAGTAGVASPAPATVAPDADRNALSAAIDRAMRGPSIRSFPPCDARGADATVALLRQRLA